MQLLSDPSVVELHLAQLTPCERLVILGQPMIVTPVFTVIILKDQSKLGGERARRKYRLLADGRLLLGDAVNRAEAGHEMRAGDADDLAAGKQLAQYSQRGAVVGMIVRGH